jgi:hypothetical protein
MSVSLQILSMPVQHYYVLLLKDRNCVEMCKAYNNFSKIWIERSLFGRRRRIIKQMQIVMI